FADSASEEPPGAGGRSCPEARGPAGPAPPTRAPGLPSPRHQSERAGRDDSTPRGSPAAAARGPGRPPPAGRCRRGESRLERTRIEDGGGVLGVECGPVEQNVLDEPGMLPERRGLVAEAGREPPLAGVGQSVRELGALLQTPDRGPQCSLERLAL